MYQNDKPENALELGDVFKCNRLSKNKTYLVVRTGYSGGSSGHDPYPDGWTISCIPIPPNKKSIEINPTDKNITHFYQSGWFGDKFIILPSEIEKIRKMKKIKEVILFKNTK